MRCIKDEILLQYLDNECSPLKNRRIDRHLQECKNCQKKYIEIQHRINNLKDKLTGLYPPFGFSKNMLGHIRAKGYAPYDAPSKRRFKKIIPISIPLFTTISLVFAVFTAVIFLQFQRISTLKNNLAGCQDGAFLVRMVENEMKVINLKTKLSNFKPIANPKIYVAKEKKDET